MAEEEFKASPEVRTGFVRGNTFGYRPVQYYVVDGEAIIEGDIVLDSVAGMEQTVVEIIGEVHRESSGGNGEIIPAAGVVITGSQFRWPGGVVPFTIDPALPDAERVTEAVEHWHARTGIRLVPRTDEQNFVTFRPGNGCSSPVGMRGGQQFVTLAPGCDRGSTIHEIGHAVGLWHEQSREDRDLFIRILWQNIEPGREHNFSQHISDGDDVGPYDFGSIMHYPTWAFSRNGQPTIETINGEAVGQRDGLSAGDIQAVNFMYFPRISLPLALQEGVYTIQQKSGSRFMDAHEIAGKDFAVVTRTAQNNATQRWSLRVVAGVYTIRQKSNNRFVDAHEIADKDFAVVTRPAQNNDTQQWIFTPAPNNTFTIQQKSNNRFVDAYATAGNDFGVVTRSAQNNSSQRWMLAPEGNNTYTIRQLSTGRFLDAHEIAANDFALVTRPAQNNDTQRWILSPAGVVCTLQQESNGRFVDAHENGAQDFAVVTRTAQNNDSQRWVVTVLGGNVYTIQQKVNRRYMDAHEIADKDFAVVTRTAQNNDTQRWLILPA